MQITGSTTPSTVTPLSSDSNTTTLNSPNKNKPSFRFLDDLTSSKLSEGLKNYLTPNKEGKVNEEQLQFALANTMLSEKSIKLGDEFTKYFAKAAASNPSIEDNVKTALQELVSKGSITENEASTLNGVTFKAAQLDTNLDMLYDGKGGPNDPTIAVASLDEALSKATSLIDSYRKGNQDISDRPLTIPSNTKDPLTTADTPSTGGTPDSVTTNRNGFLWKPVSDNNGKLVVLLPSNLSGKVESASIHSSLPPSESNIIETGKFSGIANGSRSHFRFSKPGSSFPDGAYVVAKLSNGGYSTFQIGDSSSRNT